MTKDELLKAVEALRQDKERIQARLQEDLAAQEQAAAERIASLLAPITKLLEDAAALVPESAEQVAEKQNEFRKLMSVAQKKIDRLDDQLEQLSGMVRRSEKTAREIKRSMIWKITAAYALALIIAVSAMGSLSWRILQREAETKRVGRQIINYRQTLSPTAKEQFDKRVGLTFPAAPSSDSGDS